MSGLFERIARRRATPPDETQQHDASAIAASASPGGEPALTDAPADGGEAAAVADGDAPTVQTEVLAEPGGEAGATVESAVAGADGDAPTVQSDAVAGAAGAEAGATVERDATAEPAGPSFRERGRVRRRLRYLRRVRELQLRDLGGLVFELRRFGREREDLVAEKLTQLAATDDELRGLETVLGDRRALVELREPGVGGTCSNCGALHGSADNFCAQCGRSLSEDVAEATPSGEAAPAGEAAPPGEAAAASEAVPGEGEAAPPGEAAASTEGEVAPATEATPGEATPADQAAAPEGSRVA